MARKKNKKEDAINESIIRNLPQTVEWIKQPYTLSVLRGDMGLVQTRLLTGIVEKLQGKVSDWIAHRDDEGHVLIKPEELDKDGCVTVDVSLNEISKNPQNYEQIEMMADDMQKLIFRKKVEEDGLIMNRRSSVFKDISTPDITTTSGRTMRAGFIRFRFDRDQIDNIFEIMRYSKYIKQIAMTSKSQYTNRIYMIITAYRDVSPEFNMEYNELRKIFGFREMQKVTVTDPETGKTREETQWVDTKYQEYRQFKRRVLQTAEIELKELNEQGRVDCYFDFDEIYYQGKKRGVPEKIHFIVHKSQMGQLEDFKAQNQVKYHGLRDMLKASFGLSSTEIGSLVSKISDDILEQFTIRVKEIAESIERQGDKIKDKKKYAIKSLYAALEEFTPYAEAVEVTSDTQTANTDSSSEKQAEPAKKEIVAPELSDELRSSWHVFVGALHDSLPEREYNFWISAIRIWTIANGVIQVVVPNKFYEEQFKERYESELKDAFKKAYAIDTYKVFGNIDYFNKANERN